MSTVPTHPGDPKIWLVWRLERDCFTYCSLAVSAEAAHEAARAAELLFHTQAGAYQLTPSEAFAAILEQGRGESNEKLEGLVKAVAEVQKLMTPKRVEVQPPSLLGDKPLPYSGFIANQPGFSLHVSEDAAKHIDRLKAWVGQPWEAKELVLDPGCVYAPSDAVLQAIAAKTKDREQAMDRERTACAAQPSTEEAEVKVSSVDGLPVGWWEKMQ